jgi:hypothetical protein
MRNMLIPNARLSRTRAGRWVTAHAFQAGGWDRSIHLLFKDFRLASGGRVPFTTSPLADQWMSKTRRRLRRLQYTKHGASKLT